MDPKTKSTMGPNCDEMRVGSVSSNVPSYVSDLRGPRDYPWENVMARSSVSSNVPAYVSDMRGTRDYPWENVMARDPVLSNESECVSKLGGTPDYPWENVIAGVGTVLLMACLATIVFEKIQM
jgi:hypothetical protein